ncbi:hypothetical protein BJ508DRAFT_328593 [Ascobolus immersus RN42]|uniref:ADF-H domain-containing protein n=1 Tax=Ascobolus immersus RN42 TaxID=1160509 RepID=A0A3N4I1D1_ASCIM|nr:hypothetical protein BJ508DRAFT_328593 [Ascobolus immersus RN42]
MSLNGLDAPELQLAYENAGTEPGKWFLIKYVSRDEVELLAQGANGAPEMRGHLANEPDDAPLFGYIRFRRKNVLVKYIPEAASRVIKARCQVHFQLVSERFALHDKQFNISTPRELTDSALAAACSNHSTTASVSSSTSSLRNRRLEDIAETTEEVEESEEDGDQDSIRRTLSPAPHPNKRPKSPLASEVVLSETDEDYEHSIHHTLTSNSLSIPRESLELRRNSTSSTNRPEQLLTTEQLAEIAAEKLLDELYPLKQKVRLGPRPSADASRRPHTAGSGRGAQGDSKPVAALPRSLQGKKTARDSKDRRTKGDEEAKTEGFAVNATPIYEHNLPSTSGSLSITDSFLPPKTADSTTSLHSLTPSLLLVPPPPSPGPSEPGVLSPEKQRLMRALQLRRKTMASPSIEAQTAPVMDKAVEKVVCEEPKKVAEEVSEESEAVEVNQDFPIAVKEIGSTDDRVEESKAKESGNIVREQTDKPGHSDVDEGAVKVVTEECRKEVEVEAVPRSKPIDIVTIERPEGTKVRGSESDYESDSDDSEAAVEIAIAEHHPITPLRDAFAPSSPDSSLSSTPKSPVQVRTINIPPQENKPMQPIVVQKRGDRESEEQESDIPPPIPPPRSVSAPFVGTNTAPAARRQSMQPGMPRKVNVGGGGGGVSSVLQRIRQLEQIANSKAPSPAAVPSGLTPQARSVTPTFPMKAAGLKPSSGFGLPPTLIDRSETRTAPPRPEWSRRATADVPSYSKPPSGSSEFKPRFTGTSLQVTTKIVRDEERPSTAADAIRMNAADRRASVDMSLLNTQFAGSSQQRLEPVPKSPSTPAVKKSESRSFFKSSAPKSPSGDSKGTSPTSPAESKKSFFKDKDEKKKSRTPSPGEEKKSPVLPLLRRMSSSLAWKSKDKQPAEPPSAPAPVEVPEPSSPKPRTYLLAGWVNVQLPDSLLWRRRCMKVDSNGWLFLSVTDDETTPQTRRYHIKSEIQKAQVPDLDEQELPFSVQLFLAEGGMLQAACQNTREQKEVLGVLQTCLA